MVVFNKPGSKERLFEIMKKVNHINGKPASYLNESMLPVEKKNKIIDEFVNFASEKLDLGNQKPDITISYDNSEAQNMKSFGKFTPHDNKIRVVAVNRNLADVLRTLAHEMTHYKQNLNKKITLSSGDTGSDIENEANTFAGIALREFGSKYPIIFE